MVTFRDLKLRRWDGVAHLWVAEADDTSTVTWVPASCTTSGSRRTALSAHADLLNWVEASGPFVKLCQQRIQGLTD